MANGTIVCTGQHEIPDGWDEAHHNEWNAAGMSAFGAPPPPILNGCGRELTIGDGEWDVDTDPEGNVTGRHRDVTCPFCGVRTFVRDA
jgi:hypothetical protein